MSETSPENMEREVATSVTKCPTCGEQVGIQEEREDGSLVLETHDHTMAEQRAAVGNSALPTEQAAAELPREQGTVVATDTDGDV